MKFHLYLPFGLLFIATAAVGQSVVTISSAPSGRYLVDESGIPLLDGSLVWVGSFDSPITVDTVMPPLPVEELIQMYQWTQFGEAQTRNLMGNHGKITGDVVNMTPEAGDFAGKQIFLWVFNASEADDATEYGLYSSWDGDTTWSFPQIIPDGAGISLNDHALIALVGAINGDEISLTQIIPEPSSYALLGGAFAAAAIALRRRSRRASSRA